jgi:superoxide dismutase, Fe-Mn family
MKYDAKNFESLLGMKAFSNRLLKDHMALYQGYVTNTNSLIEHLDRLSQAGQAGAPEYAELKRRFGWEYNGMRLHEYYFGNLSKSARPLDSGSPLHKELVNEFGSYSHWEKDFKATGALRGIGWAVLYYDPGEAKLFNAWISEHDTGQLFGCTPLLVMDVFEHAFLTDFGLERAEYIDAFFQSIDWSKVSRRYEEIPDRR